MDLSVQTIDPEVGISGSLILVNEYLPVDKEYTLHVLSELGFKWPETSEEYLLEFRRTEGNLSYFYYLQSSSIYLDMRLIHFQLVYNQIVV